MSLTRGEKTALLWTCGFLAFGGILKAHQVHEVKWGKAFMVPPPGDHPSGNSPFGNPSLGHPSKGNPSLGHPSANPSLRHPWSGDHVETGSRSSELREQSRAKSPSVAATSLNDAMIEDRSSQRPTITEKRGDTATYPMSSPATTKDKTVFQTAPVEARNRHGKARKETAAEICPVNVNQAEVGGLTTLPGVGPKLAERMLAYRKTHGPFRHLSDLRKIKGIGQKKLDRMKGCLIL